MALVRLENGKDRSVSREEAEEIWDILNGRIEPSEKQEKLCLDVVEVFFSWRNAPDDYIQKHQYVITKMAMMSWACNRYGNPTRPEEGDIFSYQFAEKWGLWRAGGMTDIARNPEILLQTSLGGIRR